MNEYMTTNQGTPVTDDTNSLTAGKSGPVLLEDLHLVEKLAHFHRERIPERVVHANGAGALGYFECYRSMAKYTCADFLSDAGKKTDVLVRFSTVVGSKGSADTLRDPRGFAVKFYTNAGNYDLVGNNLPVFFVRDAIKFPDMVHAFKPSPDTNIPDKNRFWDFISLTPESTHMILWLFSDRGTVKSFRKMEGFGVNTYMWVNKEGDYCYIKYHWKPVLGVETITRQEATILAGTNPDVAKEDLFNTIANGGEVVYDLKVQILDKDKVDDFSFNPFDATKVWPEDVLPLIPVGRMILNKNPENAFAQIEQAAFCPAAVVEGIQPSHDKLLQGRMFSYSDAQRYRIGANYLQLPTNKAQVTVNNNQRDGQMDYCIIPGKVNYSPNSLADGNPKEAITGNEPPNVPVNGYIGRTAIDKEDNYTQAGEFYNSLDESQQDNLVDNLVDGLTNVKKDIQERELEHLLKSDRQLGTRVAKGLGYNI